jgi:type I restriction enzyme S subunit
LGRTAIVNTTYDFIVLTPQVTYYRVKCLEKLSNRYLKYYFDSFFFQTTLKNYAGGGSTRDYIGITKQLDLPIIFPPGNEQCAIAAVLSSFDDKIELLRAQNKTLENIAQALFKHWFVDFEFPGKDGKPYKSSGGEMIDSELGEIPEGWKIGGLSEIADFLNGLALQNFPPENTTEYLPVIKIRELKAGVEILSIVVFKIFSVVSFFSISMPPVSLYFLSRRQQIWFRLSPGGSAYSLLSSARSSVPQGQV